VNALVRTVPGNVEIGRYPLYGIGDQLVPRYGRLNQAGIPKRVDASGLVVTRDLLSALRQIASPTGIGCVAAASAVVPAAPAFSSMTTAFPLVAVEDVDPAGPTGLGDPLSRLPVDHGVEQNNRARCIVVPEVVCTCWKCQAYSPVLAFRATMEVQNKLSPSRIDPS